MYIKYDYCKTSIERLFSEHGNDSFRITIHIVRLTWSYINHLLYNISVCGIWGNIDQGRLTESLAEFYIASAFKPKFSNGKCVWPKSKSSKSWFGLADILVEHIRKKSNYAIRSNKY